MSDAEDREFFRRRFPTAAARARADFMTDRLPTTASMQKYIDTWIQAYRAAGGREPKYKD